MKKSNTLTVSMNGDKEYTTIAKALENAKDGDTIVLEPGAYDECIVIDKNITLKGSSKIKESIICGLKTICKIKAKAKIKDICFSRIISEEFDYVPFKKTKNMLDEETFYSSSNYYGLVEVYSDCTFNNCKIANSASCGMIIYSGKASINSCTVDNCKKDGIHIESSPCFISRTLFSNINGYAALSINNSKGCVITYSKFFPDRYGSVGLFVNNSSYLLLKNNLFVGNAYAAYLHNSTKIKFKENIFNVNQNIGLSLVKTSHTTLLSNIFRQNRESGLFIKDSKESININDCTIIENELGIKSVASNFIVKKSSIYDNHFESIIDSKSNVNFSNDCSYAFNETKSSSETVIEKRNNTFELINRMLDKFEEKNAIPIENDIVNQEEDFSDFDKEFYLVKPDPSYKKNFSDLYNVPRTYDMTECTFYNLVESNDKDRTCPLKSFEIEKNSFTKEEANIIVDQNGKEDCKSLSEALSKAKDGDKIYIESGIYHDNVTFDKRVGICGNFNDRPTIIIKGEHRVGVHKDIFINSVNFFSKETTSNIESSIQHGIFEIFSNSIFVNCNFIGSISNVIAILRWKVCPIFYNCEIREANNCGVFVTQNASVILKKCNIHSAKIVGVYVKRANAIIEGCHIHHIGANLTAEELEDEDREDTVGVLDEDGKTTIKNSIIETDIDIGVYARRNTDLKMDNVLIRGCKKSGIDLFMKSKGTIKNSCIDRVMQDGVFVCQESQCKFVNTIIENGFAYGGFVTGVFIEGNCKCTFNSCTIRNLYGIGINVFGHSKVKLDDTKINDIKISYKGFPTGIKAYDYANITITNSEFYNMDSSAIHIGERAKALLENVNIHSCFVNKEMDGMGAIVFDNAKLTIKESYFHDIDGYGIGIFANEDPIVENTDFVNMEDAVLRDDSYEPEAEDEYNFSPYFDDMPENSTNYKISNGHLLDFEGAMGEAFVPEGTTLIDVKSFELSTSIEILNISSTVKTIDKIAFLNLPLLSEIKVSEDNKYFASKDGVLYNKDMTRLVFIPPLMRYITIPSTVKNIDHDAFLEIDILQYIDVEKGNKTFASYKGTLFNKELTVLVKQPNYKQTIFYPKTTTVIGDQAFLFNNSLGEVFLPDGITKICDLAFAYSTLTFVHFPTTLKEIGASIFENCEKLKEHNIPFELKKIQPYMYKDCTSLTKIQFKEVVSIETEAFKNCQELTHVNIPMNVLAIGSEAFAECTKLESISIPPTVNYIDETAFNVCPSLYQINLSSANPFFKMENKLLVPYDHKRIITAEKDLETLIIPPTVEYISPSSFLMCTNIKGKVELPKSIKEIGEFAFGKCINITEIEIPEGVKAVDVALFMQDTNLTKVTLPSTIKEIREMSFYECENLSEINIPEGVTTIKANAFEGCKNLRKVTLPSTLKEVDETAFNNTNGISFTFPNKNAFLKVNSKGIFSKK